MSLPIEERLAVQDAAISGLGLLLDEQALMEAINLRLPGAGVNAIEKKYIRYKPGMNCLVRYELETDSGTIGIYAKAYGPDAGVKLEKAGGRHVAASWKDVSRLIIAERNIVVCTFPNDDKLKVLHRLAIPRERESLLKRVFPEQSAFHQADFETLQYKPERRYVACLQGAGGEQAALKIYTAEGFAAAEKVYQSIGEAGVRAFPAVIGTSRRHRVIVSRWISGCRLSDIYADSEFNLEWAGELGRHLADFHQSDDASRLVQLLPQQQTDKLVAMVQTFQCIAPEHAQQAQALTLQIAVQLQSIPPVMMRIHGDFYAKQVLCTDNGIQLVDSDEVRCGHPAEDIGLFLAHLERDVLRGQLSRVRADRLEEIFLAAYPGATDTTLHMHIQLYAAVGLMQLLHHPFRNCEPDYIERMAEILTACESRLAKCKSAEGGKSLATGTRGGHAVTVSDPYAVTLDPKMPFLVKALDPDAAARELNANLYGRSNRNSSATLHAIRVQRYRAGRRCLIEYDLSRSTENSTKERFTLFGKSRARGLDKQAWELNRFLHENGFSEESADGVAVPEPFCRIPAFNMWLQKRVDGISAWSAMTADDGVRSAQRIADAIFKLHSVRMPVMRTHTIDDEIRILETMLAPVSAKYPQWSARLEKILDACRVLAAGMGSSMLTGIHRDFYHDQVIASASHLYLLDLDLFCMGDPALDIGNFIAHVQEQCIREMNDIDAMNEISRTIIDRYQQRSGRDMAEQIDNYRNLTLVRHIAISRRIAERRAFTEQLIDLSEAQLGVIQCPQNKSLLNQGAARCR